MNLIGVKYEVKNRGHVKERTVTKDPATNILGNVNMGLIEETVFKFGANTPLIAPEANPASSELMTVNPNIQNKFDIGVPLS